MLDMLWQYFEGRDNEGNKFAHHILLHGSGSIMGKVYMPDCGSDSYQFGVGFFFRIDGRSLDDDEGQARFIDLASAKAFVETIVASVDSLALPFKVTKQSYRQKKQRQLVAIK